MALPDLQRYPWKLNLIKNVEDISKSVFFSVSFSIGSYHKQEMRKTLSQRILKYENKQFKLIKDMNI